MTKTILAVMVTLGLAFGTISAAHAAAGIGVQDSVLGLIKGGGGGVKASGASSFGGQVMGSDTHYATSMEAIKNNQKNKSTNSQTSAKDSLKQKATAMKSALKGQLTEAAAGIKSSLKSQVKSAAKGKIKSLIKL